VLGSTSDYYTAAGRLGDILRVYPVDRGSLWYVLEAVWGEANPSYADVRNPERTGHFGLGAATLTATQPTTVPLLHGHSSVQNREGWFHVRVTGVRAKEFSRETWFDVWHRYAVAWREFFTEGIQRNLDKKALSGEELVCLGEIEARIRQKTGADHARARREYQHHPAWRKHFPESVPHPSPGTQDGGE